MAERRAEDSGNIAKSAAEIVGRLSARLKEMTLSIQKTLGVEIAELSDDAQLLALQRDTVEANVDTVFSAIRHSIPIKQVEPPTPALEYARRLAQREVSANALVRAYRLGHQEVLSYILDEIRTSKLDPAVRLDVYDYITTISFGYIDWMSQQVLIAYQDEYDSWLQSRNSQRAQRVREILDESDIDVDAMTTAIRYPLARIHLAVVAWYSEGDNGDELVRMERFINQLAQALDGREAPLFISVDRLTGWAWIPLPADSESDVSARIRAYAEAQPDSPWIAIGHPLSGVDGFRRSHRHAELARAVAIGSGTDGRRVTAATDSGVAVAALLGDNIAGAGQWIAETLGPLARSTDSDERLRETLRVFLRTGSRFKPAADQLHLHPNTVKYRVNRAIDRRGRPISDDRLDVEVALLLCHWFGSAVLS